MPKQNRLALYADVKQVLDGALAAGGGDLTLSTHGEAVHWRQRAYKFRKAYASFHGDSPYDILTLPRIDGVSKVVRIEVRRAKGVFTPRIPTPVKNSFDEVAGDLASRLLGDDAI